MICMYSIARGAAAFAAAAVLTFGGGCLPLLPEAGVAGGITAFAEQTAAPELKTADVYGSKLALTVANVNEFPEGTVFRVYVGGNKIRSYTSKKLAALSGRMTLTHDGESLFKGGKQYTIKVKAILPDGGSTVSQRTVRTAKKDWFAVKKGAVLYRLSGGSMVPKKTQGSTVICRGVLTDSQGKAAAGRPLSEVSAEYVRVYLPVKNGKNENNEQLYKYVTYYVKNVSADVGVRSVSAMRKKVTDYALSMSRKRKQTYVLCGEYVGKDETRSDCSGLTKLSYLRIGWYMEHNAEEQANMGGKMVYDNIRLKSKKNGVRIYEFADPARRVDYSALKKGDLVFFICSTNNQETDPVYVNDGIGHVGMYIGGGKMVHFTSSYGITNHPCRTEKLSKYEKEHLVIARAVRFIY